MSHATLASLQGALADIYDLPATPDIAQFLMTDRAGVGHFDGARNSDEQLIVAEDGAPLWWAFSSAAAVLDGRPHRIRSSRSRRKTSPTTSRPPKASAISCTWRGTRASTSR